MPKRAVAIALALAALPSAAFATGNATNGARAFARCAMCHSSAKGAGNRIGPDLFGVVGRRAGTAPGFSYSAAMRNAGFVWTDAKLDAYIASPRSVVPGNRMPFAGLPSPSQRAGIVAYLNTLK